ncbi:3-keto-steroid reductase/17-beta-hydroxysteroid dehydrogenase 7-like [Antedon mediterranea]|uniref:3-keto-steroid reductase/17-beta-hydroxysteroid dehydrogenase 7-like n=1 Tax=Antedon mediterranea TaxID=105859 RepID=UPI003AF6628A
MQKVVLITGANSGVGFSVADRLLEIEPSLTICLACRNLARAQVARSELLAKHGSKCTIDVQSVDTSDLKSVYKAAEEIKQRYKCLNYLYLNAGIMPVSTINWKGFLKGLFSVRRVIEMFSTGEGLLSVKDHSTDDGLKAIFTTNIFGHFVLVLALKDLLVNSKTHIIWTSSSNARRSHFNINDVQHEQGSEPYSSSKYAIDLLSLAINYEWNSHGVYSHITCPGLSITNITNSILPKWLWRAITPVMCSMRLFVPRITLSPYNSAEALVWLFQQDPAAVAQDRKYISHCNVLGKRYTHAEIIDFDVDEANELYEKLAGLEQVFRNRFKS